MTPEEKTIAREIARASWAFASLQLLRLFPLGDGSHATAERRLFVAAVLLESFAIKCVFGFLVPFVAVYVYAVIM